MACIPILFPFPRATRLTPSLLAGLLRAGVGVLPAVPQVAYLLVLGTLNTGVDMQMTYQSLILQYSQVLDYFPTVFVSEPLCVFGARRVVSCPQPDSPPEVLVSAPTQLFAWRIWSLTRVRATPVLKPLMCTMITEVIRVIRIRRQRGVPRVSASGSAGASAEDGFELVFVKRDIDKYLALEE
ncbi:hypothetical protein K438DRAFT_1941179 [Mycena galopus ATCC 62051]|nr:hypothetical protein K438DRAFT_1941179 [Mycena galopus ATCC 62051]